MKIIFKNSIFVLTILFSLTLGYFTGIDIGSDFMNLYLGKLAHIPIRYAIILSLIYIDYQNFITLNYISVMFRFKSLFSYLTNTLIKSFKYIILFFLIFNLPIFIMNSNNFINNIYSIFLIIVNDIIILLLFITIIRIIDIKIKNGVLSSCIFIIFLTISDFILEHYNFFMIENINFDFSYIFILPSVYNNYYIIIVIIIFIIIFNLSITSWLIVRKDYILNEKVVEKN